MATSEVNGMERRRRRAQCPEAVQPQEDAPALADESAEKQLQISDEPVAPRRRRRAQPPQQITQRMQKISIPEDVKIPQLPVIEEKKPEKKHYKKTKSKEPAKKLKDEAHVQQKKEAAVQAAKKGVSAAGAVLRIAGYAILSLLILLMDSGKMLSKGMSRLLEKFKVAQLPRNEKPDAREVVLEAIQPQDYHGRGAQHAAQQQKEKAHSKTHSKKHEIRITAEQRQRLISAVLVIVALVSLYNIGSILLRTFRTTRLNAQLSERYASMSQDMSEADEAQAFEVYEAEETPMPVPTQTPVPQQEEPKEENEEEEEPAVTAAPQMVKSTKYHHVGGNALPEMEALYNENRDLVAWLNIPDVIDLPVVYKDNSYYLKRDFYKQKNNAGTIFLDENHPFKEKTQNLLLHGHNMKDGTMFGRLTQYIYDRTYIKNHPFINLSTLWRKEQYVIFAVLDVSLDPRDEAFFNYFTHATFSSDAEFTSYIRQLQLRSMVAIPIDVEPSDALLTLSTCLEDNRLVIVARRLRTGETRQASTAWAARSAT